MLIAATSPHPLLPIMEKLRWLIMFEKKKAKICIYSQCFISVLGLRVEKGLETRFTVVDAHTSINKISVAPADIKD